MRSLCDEDEKTLFTFQELAKIVGSENRQAASQHVEDFRDCGEDFQNLVVRKKKVDSTVVEAVESVLMDEPLMKVSEITQKVNKELGRDDLSYANIQVAMDQISSRVMRSSVKKQIEEGEAHYKEDYLLQEMTKTLSSTVGEKADLETSFDSGMELSDPTSIRNLVTPDIPVSQISDKLKWIVFILNLYFWGVPLSRLGQWMNVHKTTILRWIMGLVLSLWPLVYSWIIDRVKGSIVYVDEKWIKIHGKWHYWFVVLDSETQIPIVSSLLSTLSSWSCRWIGVKLKRIGKIPKVIVTDGLLGYKKMLPEVKHQLCIFHHQQGVTRTQEIISVSENFNGPYEVRNRTMFILGISTGGRIAELLSLKIEDVWQGGQPVSDLLYEKNVVKGKKNSRLIPLNSDARQAIVELVSWHKEKFGSLDPKRPLFPSRKGNDAISTTQGYRVLKDAFMRAGLNGKVATHSMRKTYAQRLYDATGDIYLVAEALGHKAVETTKKYLGVSYDKLRRASEEIELCNRMKLSLHSDISDSDLILLLAKRGWDISDLIDQLQEEEKPSLAKVVKFPKAKVID